jgi:hypothetical protein
MKDFEFPTPPEPEDIPFYRRIPTVYYWWFGAVFFLGLTVIWLPSQCTLDSLGLPEEADELEGFPKVDQDRDLEFREDQLWYSLGSNEPFTGVAEAFHPNGKVRSRTKIREGLAYGLIEEWDENGTVDGPRFKGEFVP